MQLYDKERLAFEVALRAQVASGAAKREHAARKLAEKEARLAHLAAIDAGRSFPGAITTGPPSRTP